MGKQVKDLCEPVAVWYMQSFRSYRKATLREGPLAKAEKDDQRHTEPEYPCMESLCKSCECRQRGNNFKGVH